MGNSESKDDARPSGSHASQHAANDGLQRSASKRDSRHQKSSSQHSQQHADSDTARSMPRDDVRKGAPLKSTPTPPTAHIINSPVAVSPSTSNEHAHATVTSVSPSRTRSRPRSATLGASKPLPFEPASSQPRSDSMTVGSENSKHSRPASRSATMDQQIPIRTTASPVDIKPEVAPAQPMDVPQPPAGHDLRDNMADLQPSAYSESPYGGIPPLGYSRPPRLPLPIEEETYTPGSPIITPQDVSESLNADEIPGGTLASRGSVLSSNADEDENGDNDTYVQENEYGQTRIDSKLTWNSGGQKVYVTGTFCAWDKKIKLQRHADGSFSTVLPLPPGTHHIKFLVDGDMVTNPDMPTTVDWHNILVNYYEVAPPGATAPPQQQQQQQQAQQPKKKVSPARPIPIPGAATSAEKERSTESAAPSKSHPTTSRTPHSREGATPAVERSAPSAAMVDANGEPKLKPKSIPRMKYTQEIPQYLLDLDRYANPEDDRFVRATKTLNILPQPPGLPMFLNKSILNSSTPQKDDASVLVMPNHTVINHLATSSIKGGVLAISGTTRYKRKYLTTMMYKPSSSDG